MEPELLIFMMYNIVTSCSGIFCYIFIVVSTVRNWKKENSPNLILFTIALTNAIFKIFQLPYDVSGVIGIDFYSYYNLCLVYIDSFYFVSIFFSTCLTSWLCSFYCINIVSFQHRPLMILKTKFPTLVPWMIVGTLGVSIILLVLQISVTLMYIPIDHTSNYTGFCFIYNETYNEDIPLIFNKFTIVIVIPFILILVSLGYTFVSLLAHVQRLQSSSSLRNPNLRSHLHAVKIMILLLILNVLFYMSYQTMNTSFLSELSPWLWTCIVMYYSLYPLQACVLIMGNKTLNASCVRCFYRLRTSQVPS